MHKYFSKAALRWHGLSLAQIALADGPSAKRGTGGQEVQHTTTFKPILWILPPGGVERQNREHLA